MGCGASTPAYTMEVAPEGLTDLASAAAAADTADASQHGGAGARSRDPNAPVTIEHFEGAGRELIRRDIIGKGGKSVGVQVAYHPRAKEYYAIKFISEDLAAKEQWAVPPQEELAAMRDITLARTPFVVPLRGWFEDGGTLALVMGYMPGACCEGEVNKHHAAPTPECAPAGGTCPSGGFFQSSSGSAGRP